MTIKEIVSEYNHLDVAAMTNVIDTLMSSFFRNSQPLIDDSPARVKVSNCGKIRSVRCKCHTSP